MKQRRVTIKQVAAEACVSIEHGHANNQGNDYSSVAYWYQTGKHAHHEELPPVEDRLPRRWPEHGLWDE